MFLEKDKKMSILIRPIQEKESEAVYQMFQDIPAKENNTSNHANGISFSEFDDFCKKAVEGAERENLTVTNIPEILYLMFDDKIPVGFAKFRPFLNKDCAQKRVSQYAYMISPKHRGKGYASMLLAFLKEESVKIGLLEVEVGALKENAISRHIIEKNGGILTDTIKQRVIYRIPLKGKIRQGSKL